MKDIDGTETLAGAWPKNVRLTHCSGDIEDLENELLVAWDTLAHALVRLMNVHNLHDEKHPIDRYNRPKIEILEYSQNTEAIVSYPETHDGNFYSINIRYKLILGMPSMGAQPLYNRDVLAKYTESQENARK